MALKLDFEFPQNFDRELGNLRAAAKNVQNASAELGPGLRVYINALKTLNAEMLGSLDRFYGAWEKPEKLATSTARRSGGCVRGPSPVHIRRRSLSAAHPHRSQTGEAAGGS
jgi:hypothetical protein